MILKENNPRQSIITSYKRPVLYKNIALYQEGRLMNLNIKHSLLNVLLYIVCMKTIFLLLGLILFGFIIALQYKHLWKDVPELFKDLKNKKKN